MSVTLEQEIGVERLYAVPVPDAALDEGGAGRAVAAFARAAADMANPGGIDELLHVVAREMITLAGVERCSIHLRDEAGGVFRGYVGQSGAQALDDDIKRSLAGVPADGMTRELMETHRPVIITDARVDPRMVQATVRFWKIRSIMAVPMIVAGEVVGVVFLDDVNRRRAFTVEEGRIAAAFANLVAVPILNAQAQMELRSQLDTSRRQLKSLRHATSVDERLSEVVLEGRPLQDVLDTLAELLGKPCAVFSNEGERLATALPQGAGADGIVPRLLEPELANRPAVREVLAAHEGSRAYVVGPLPAAGVLHRHVVAPVMLGSEVWGRLVVMEHKTRFIGGDIVTLRRAATLIALHVSTERKVLEADWNAGSSLVCELLSGCTDSAGVTRRADRLGVKLDLPRAVVVISARSRSEERVPDFRAAADAFSRVTPELNVHVTSLAGAAVALVEVPADADPTTFVASYRSRLQEIRRQLPGSERLIAGVSTVQSDRAGYRAAYLEAKQVLDCIRRFSPTEGPELFTADELGPGRVFLTTADGDLVTSFAETTFGGLVEDESKADLVQTLCSFFHNMGSIRRSAVSLGVHDNTIRYRLTRIEELTGLAVMHDPDAQLRARLSLLALLLQGRLPMPE